MAPTVVDASPSYQPDMAGDAPSLAAAGITRAILKASEGATWPNPGTPEAGWYTQTRDALHAAGITTDVYHLTHAADPVDAEVANLVRNVGNLAGVRVWIDSESTEGNAERMRSHVGDLAAAIAREGGTVGEYVNRDTFDAMGGIDGAGGRPVWLAVPGWTPADAMPFADVVLVQTGQQAIGSETYDVNIEVTPAPATPAPQPQPAPTPAPGVGIAYHDLDLRNADHQLVTAPGVKALQGLLTGAGFTLAIDGKAGPATKAAVLAYQAHHGLATDAIVGPATLAHLLAS